jgi:hypothetical protein
MEAAQAPFDAALVQTCTQPQQGCAAFVPAFAYFRARMLSQERRSGVVQVGRKSYSRRRYLPTKKELTRRRQSNRCRCFVFSVVRNIKHVFKVLLSFLLHEKNQILSFKNENHVQNCLHKSASRSKLPSSRSEGLRKSCYATRCHVEMMCMVPLVLKRKHLPYCKHTRGTARF